MNEKILNNLKSDSNRRLYMSLKHCGLYQWNKTFQKVRIVKQTQRKQKEQETRQQKPAQTGVTAALRIKIPACLWEKPATIGNITKWPPTLDILWQFLKSWRWRKKSEKYVKTIQKGRFNSKMELLGEVRQTSNLLKVSYLKKYRKPSNKRTDRFIR